MAIASMRYEVVTRIKDGENLGFEWLEDRTGHHVQGLLSLAADDVRFLLRASYTLSPDLVLLLPSSLSQHSFDVIMHAVECRDN